MRQDIFGAPVEQGKKTGLSIGTKVGKQLTKAQKDFNRLVKKVEDSRKKVASVSAVLDDKLDYFTKHIFPLDADLLRLNTSYVKLLYGFYNEKKLFSKKERDVLAEVIGDYLGDVLSMIDGQPDDELKAIFKVVNGISYEEQEEEEFEEMKADMEYMFETMGVKMDMGGAHKDMTPEEVAAYMHNQHKLMEEQLEALKVKKESKKKTKKQQEKEDKEKQKEAIRNKSISTIYKQLAKAFHPDLEKDETLKAQKEDMMKQLTVAYEKNDLHTLLRLEIEWMQKEEQDVERLTDDKLSVYNELLKEQVAELEMELVQVYEHPRYESLLRFAEVPRALPFLNMGAAKDEIKDEIKFLEKTELELKGKNAIVWIKGLIKEKREEMKFGDFAEDEMMRLMAAMMRGR